jgi:hypothetical protein
MKRKQATSICRVANCVLLNFNKPQRSQENLWVPFYGIHNQLGSSFTPMRPSNKLLQITYLKYNGEIEIICSKANFNIIKEGLFEYPFIETNKPSKLFTNTRYFYF